MSDDAPTCACLDAQAMRPGASQMTPPIPLQPGQRLHLHPTTGDRWPTTLWVISPWIRRLHPAGLGYRWIRPPLRGDKTGRVTIEWANGRLTVEGHDDPDSKRTALDVVQLGHAELHDKTLDLRLHARTWGVQNVSIEPGGPHPLRAFCPRVTDFDVEHLCASCNPAQPLSCLPFDTSDPKVDFELLGAGALALLVLRVTGFIRG